LQLLVLLAGVVTADEGLHPGDDLGQFVITHLLKLTQDSGLEEDLFVFQWAMDGVSDTRQTMKKSKELTSL
jgi:hypothetical protein